MTNDTTMTSSNVPRIIIPKRHVDGRGWFNETFHERDQGPAGGAKSLNRIVV
jgi:dTDP-4-dehydrorhamnose 3,5-epimerase-like enzyme